MKLIPITRYGRTCGLCEVCEEVWVTDDVARWRRLHNVSTEIMTLPDRMSLTFILPYSKNVARAWTYETAVMCGQELDENLPYNE